MKTPHHIRPCPDKADPKFPGRSLNGQYIAVGVECLGIGDELIAGGDPDDGGNPAWVVFCPNCARDMRYKMAPDEVQSCIGKTP